MRVLQKINENEVVTTLPDAIDYIMRLDKIEEAFAEKRDDKVLDYFLGLPKVQISMCYTKPNAPRDRYWTGTAADIPVGPSTKWLTYGLTDDRGNPLEASTDDKSDSLDVSPRKKLKLLEGPKAGNTTALVGL
jgi:hypothetical protein